MRGDKEAKIRGVITFSNSNTEENESAIIPNNKVLSRVLACICNNCFLWRDLPRVIRNRKNELIIDIYFFHFDNLPVQMNVIEKYTIGNRKIDD